LQIQGKWYRERKPKEKSKTCKTKIPKLFVTPCFFLVKKRPFLSAIPEGDDQNRDARQIGGTTGGHGPHAGEGHRGSRGLERENCGGG